MVSTAGSSTSTLVSHPSSGHGQTHSWGEVVSTQHGTQHWSVVGRRLSAEKPKLIGVSRDFAEEEWFSFGDWEVVQNKTREHFQGLYVSKHRACMASSILSITFYDHFLPILISGPISSMEGALASFSFGALRGLKFFLFMRTVGGGD